MPCDTAVIRACLRMEVFTRRPVSATSAGSWRGRPRSRSSRTAARSLWTAAGCGPAKRRSSRPPTGAAAPGTRPGADSRAKRNGLSEADLDVPAKLLEQRLGGRQEAEALPRRQVVAEHDLLQLGV